jgi:hypothetical protein
MMIHHVNTGSSAEVSHTASVLRSSFQLSLSMVCVMLFASALFAQFDPLTNTSGSSDSTIRECAIVFKRLSNVESQCSRVVENPIDLGSLQSAFQDLKLHDVNENTETIVQIPIPLSDAAVSWMQKVWRAHEKIASGASIESMVPFSLESQLKAIQKLATNSEPFSPETPQLPPIAFQILVHATPINDGGSSSSTTIAQRLIVVPSPSPLSVKSMRDRLSLPAAMIDKSGLKPVEFFQIRALGLSGFQDAFKRHEQSVVPFTRDYHDVLSQGSEIQIRDFNSKLLEKWQKFQTQFSKWPLLTSEFEIKMEQAKRSGGQSYGLEDYYAEQTSDPYGDKRQRKPTKKPEEKFKEQVGKKVDRFLFKALFQSVSRFLAGTSRPVQELIEAEKGFRFLKRELIGDQAKVIEEIFAKQAVLAIDSTSIFLIDGKTALDLAFTQVGCLGIADDLINLDRPENGDDEERGTNRANQSTIDQTISFLNELNFITKQPALPSPPEDPASFPGKLITIYEVALNLLDQVQTDDKYELLAKLQVKLVLALMAEGYAALPNNPQQFNDPEGSAFSPTTIKSAYRLIDAARIDSTFLAAEEERNQWNAKTQSPEFQNSPEVQSYRELKADWESECKIIQSKWDGHYESRIKQWITKRDAMIAYVRSLNNRSEKNLSLKRIEDSVSAIPRIEALAQACEPSKGRPLCLIPSLIAIQSSIEDGRINQGVGPGRIEDRNPFPNSNSNPFGF